MIPSYTINAINAIMLLSAGLIGYFIHATDKQDLLLAAGIGILLLACTYHLRKHNQSVAHTVTAVTLLSGFYFILLFQPALPSSGNSHLLFLIMGISCFTATAFYVGAFVRERRRRDNTLYKEDL